MTHDPESTIQDADLEMNSLVCTANRMSRLKKKGICFHGWRFAPDHGEAKCLDCGKVFKNSAEMEEETRELRIEYL